MRQFMSTSTTIDDIPGVEHARPVVAAIALFVAWTLGTWLLEGRIETLLRPDAVAARTAYAFGVNIILALGAGGVLLASFLRRGAITLGRSGLAVGPLRTPVAVAAGFVLGGAAYALQGAPTWEPVVLANAFAQVFVVSAAEVVVCWVLVGNTVREAVRGRNRYLAPVIATIVASVLFGVYHFAHSPPFDTWGMVGLLTVVGLFTSVFYFVSRDVWGTIAFHNMLALYGVVSALVEQGAVSAFETLVPPLFVTAGVAVATLIGVQVGLSRMAPGTGHRP
jgi:hypothetical protein